MRKIGAPSSLGPGGAEIPSPHGHALDHLSDLHQLVERNHVRGGEPLSVLGDHLVGELSPLLVIEQVEPASEVEVGTTHPAPRVDPLHPKLVRLGGTLDLDSGIDGLEVEPLDEFIDQGEIADPELEAAAVLPAELLDMLSGHS